MLYVSEETLFHDFTNLAEYVDMCERLYSLYLLNWLVYIVVIKAVVIVLL